LRVFSGRDENARAEQIACYRAPHLLDPFQVNLTLPPK